MGFFEREQAEIAAALEKAQPCPACGHKPEMRFERGKAYISCGHCGLAGPRCSRIDGAVPPWNRLSYKEEGQDGRDA